jgi:hypothetical protein
MEQAVTSYDLKRLTKVNLPKNLKSHKSLYETDRLVEQLITKHGLPNCRPLYRKAAWYLSESDIVNCEEKAANSNADNKQAYFIRCLQNALKKRYEMAAADDPL